MRRTYGKLIRDRVPELMDADGVRYGVDVLDEAAFRAALLKKLVEEAAEVRAAEGRSERVKELADVLDDAAFRAALLEKLVEEAGEVRAADGRSERVKELADVLEVVEALLEVEGVGWDEVRGVQEARRASRGGFRRRLRLRWTEKD